MFDEHRTAAARQGGSRSGRTNPNATPNRPDAYTDRNQGHRDRKPNQYKGGLRYRLVVVGAVERLPVELPEDVRQERARDDDYGPEDSTQSSLDEANGEQYRDRGGDAHH